MFLCRRKVPATQLPTVVIVDLLTRVILRLIFRPTSFFLVTTDPKSLAHLQRRWYSCRNFAGLYLSTTYTLLRPHLLPSPFRQIDVNIGCTKRVPNIAQRHCGEYAVPNWTIGSFLTADNKMIGVDLILMNI